MGIFHKKHTTVHTASVLNNFPTQNLLHWEPGSHERIMIIAPHPDDEVLAAGGVIALHNPSKIRIIVATNGDASYATALSHGMHLVTTENFKRLAVMRQQESLNAIASLGVKSEQVHFWGFPDRGLTALWQSHWDKQHPYRSSTTGHKHSIQALNSPVLPFAGSSLEELFRKEFSEFDPTTIIMPHPQDHHSDHSALAGFTLLAAKQYYSQARRSIPTLLAYWMWARSKPWMTGTGPHNIERILINDSSAIANTRHLMLTPETLEQKRTALQYYRSQKLAAGKIFREVSRNTYEAFTLLQPAL